MLSTSFPMALPTLLAFIIGIFVLPFFGHSGEASVVAVYELNCKTDYDCSAWEFCLQSGKISYCSTCVDCQHYNREPTACARSRKDCGKCLPGFIELGAHCSPRVKEHVMGYQDEQNSKFHHGTHVLLLVCGLSVLIVAVGVILPCQQMAAAEDTREQANSQNLLVRRDANHFDPSVTVLHEPLWDANAPFVPETDPVDSAPQSQRLADPSEGDEDSCEAGHDGIEFALCAPASPSDPLASLIWDELQRGSERCQTDGPGEMANDLTEKTIDFSAIVLDGGDEALMEIDGNEGDGGSSRTSAS